MTNVLEGTACGCDLDSLLERVERTGADIAIDDAERAEREGDGGGWCRKLRFAETVPPAVEYCLTILVAQPTVSRRVVPKALSRPGAA